MTATPYGFWINRARTVRRITEHGHAVMQNPGAYGLRKAQVEAIVGPQGSCYNSQEREHESVRGRLYRLVMEQGWIRLRGSNQAWSIQFLGDAPSAVAAVWRHFANEWWADHTSISFADIDWETPIVCQAPELRDLVAARCT
ncbi:MAG: hypothetical protein EA402_14280 [Planctomycetota bacterium]|nr:MAG: hypothetical protein EA402_14280 [Planctomycetota bacterium]